MPSEIKPKNLAGVATVLSLVACYGTLAMVTVLGMLGTTIALNEAIWAGAIVFFAALALFGLAFGFVRHRQIGPVAIGLLGAAAVTYAMYVHYDRIVELAGFAVLCGAVIWDWRLQKKSVVT